MKTLSAILLHVVVLTGCAGIEGNPPVCGGPLDSSTTRTESSVKLKLRSSDPMLYWISGHYAVLMSPDSVISLLQSWIAEDPYSRDTPILLDWIKADIPLADDTDISKYVIRNTRVERLPQRIAAALLESGDASVIDMFQLDADKNLHEVQVVKLENGGDKWRYLCEKGGEEILWVTDLIASLPAQGPPNNSVGHARKATRASG